MSKYALAVVALLAAGCSQYAVKDRPSPATTTATALPERTFAGKVLVVHLKSDPDSALTIEQPVVRHLSGRAFLIGVCVEDGTEEDWRAGLTVWTAMDDIAQIVELRDREALRKRMQDVPDEDDVGKPTRA